MTFVSMILDFLGFYLFFVIRVSTSSKCERLVD